MAFDVVKYIDILRRAEEDQSSVEGRLARTILRDFGWPYTAAASTQQARIDTIMADTALSSKHQSKHGRQYDAATLKTIVQEFIDKAS